MCAVALYVTYDQAVHLPFLIPAVYCCVLRPLAAAVAAAAAAVLLWLLVMRRRAASKLPPAYAGSKDPEASVTAAAAGVKSDGALGSLTRTSPHDDSSTAGTRWVAQQQQQCAGALRAVRVDCCMRQQSEGVFLTCSSSKSAPAVKGLCTPQMCTHRSTGHITKCKCTLSARISVSHAVCGVCAEQSCCPALACCCCCLPAVASVLRVMSWRAGRSTQPAAAATPHHWSLRQVSLQRLTTYSLVSYNVPRGLTPLC
jgi:hypothetical protein